MPRRNVPFRPDPFDLGRTLTLADRVHPKYKPVFDAYEPRARAALAWYFLPHNSEKEVLLPTRPRECDWYCPFADQRHFPSGHRYCVNVFAGCAHRCEYCYAVAYRAGQAKCKAGFVGDLGRDLVELESWDVPPAPVHLSNSTDPFQPLEVEARHTRSALEHIARCRHRFTSVVILTKNPRLALEPAYCELLQKLAVIPTAHSRHEAMRERGVPGVRVEVSLAFWRDDVSAVMDHGAPPVSDRMGAVRDLRRQEIPVVLRIDPLFPRSPIKGRSMPDYGLPECQSLDDLDRLLAFAAEVGAMHVVCSPAKIVKPKDVPGKCLSPVMEKLKRVYDDLAAPSEWRSLSWRLPQALADELLVQPFLDLCRRHGVMAQYCKQNLITTP